jgi:hypothetical protein
MPDIDSGLMGKSGQDIISQGMPDGRIPEKFRSIYGNLLYNAFEESTILRDLFKEGIDCELIIMQDFHQTPFQRFI